MTKEAQRIQEQLDIISEKLSELFNEECSVENQVKVSALKVQEKYLKNMLCERCDGAGEISKTPTCRSIYPIEIPCPECGGTGVYEPLQSVFYPYEIE